MNISPPLLPWAKLRREDDPWIVHSGARGRGEVVAWCSLIDHSADVAAIFSAMLAVPVVAARLAKLAGLSALDPVLAARLGVLAGLHDFGKANHGFQNRWDPAAPPIGHMAEALDGLKRSDKSEALCKVLPVEDVLSWGGAAPLLMALGHHGYPIQPDMPELADGSLWSVRENRDPIASLAPLGTALKGWFPEAFESLGTLPRNPALYHFASGLLTLADWVASDESVVPLSPVGRSEGVSRFARLREIAPAILRRIGFDPCIGRNTLIDAPHFSAVSPHSPTPVQLETGVIGDEQIVILESETGSGKTEAALLRFARLFQAAAVDGLYFALPTRVAATALHARVETAAKRLWPEPATRPAVILAVPGQGRNVDRGIEAPAGGIDRWTNEPRELPWSAGQPKKFLAGTIAVGTIDQALLAIVKSKHAHLRLASLSRHLLVIDEVHASDLYMEILLARLLRFHRAAGGHALLLSATLGARARAELLGGKAPPPLGDAIAAPYPALSHDTAPMPRGIPWSGREKQVILEMSSAIGDPGKIAETASAAARLGAKVLVIRNTRRAAVETFEALLRSNPATPVFRLHGVPTLHHGRFAREDRARLDTAIEGAIGRERADGGLVVIGTQTLEQSLDIDADLLITDLCPADVLLQRIGRLHRHQRYRTAGFEKPRALVLSPEELSPLIRRPAHGLGSNDRHRQPYSDLVGVEATRRLILQERVWTIPAMNRRLVELTTHPEEIVRLGEALVSDDPIWSEAVNRGFGHAFVHKSEAARALLPTEKCFDDPETYFGSESDAATRLGAQDLLIELAEAVTGPFGHPVKTFAVPFHWWSGRIDNSIDVLPSVTTGKDRSMRIAVQDVFFHYDALGLHPERHS